MAGLSVCAAHEAQRFTQVSDASETAASAEIESNQKNSLCVLFNYLAVLAGINSTSSSRARSGKAGSKRDQRLCVDKNRLRSVLR